MKSTQILSLFLIVLLIAFIGYSESSTLVRYAPKLAPKSYDFSFSTTNCGNIKYDIVIDEPKGLKTLTTNTPDVVMTYLIDRIQSSQYLIRLNVQIPINSENLVLSVIVTNNANEQFAHPLPNYPLNCKEIPMNDVFANALYSPLIFNNILQLATFSIVTELTAFQSQITCASNIGEACYMSQTSDTPSEFIISMEARTQISTAQNIILTLTSIYGDEYIKEFENPYFSKDSTQLEISNVKQMDSIFHSNGEYPIKVASFEVVGEPKDLINYRIDPELMVRFPVPITGNKNSRKYMMSSNSFDSVYGDRLFTIYYGQQTLSQVTMNIKPRATRSAWTLSSQFTNDQTAGVPILKITINQVSVSDPLSISYGSYQEAIPYPYGIKKVASQDYGFVYSISKLFAPQLSTSLWVNANNLHAGASQSLQSPLFGTPDISSPVLEIVTKKVLNENTVVYTLHIKDIGSGVYSIMSVNPPQGPFYAIDCLSKGNLNDGYFDIPVTYSSYDLFGPVPQFQVYDVYGRTSIFTTDSMISTNFELDSSLLITQQPYKSVHDITFFEFNQHSFDSSYQYKKTSLFMNVTNIDKSTKPILVFAEPTNKLNSGALSFTGSYDEAIGMYRIDFELPVKTPTKELYYFVILYPSMFNFLSISAKFGKSALISFDNTEYDNYPPMITNVEFINGQNIERLPNQVDDVEVGWKFTITDRPSGFKSGNITVVSNFDGEPRVFSFDENSRISGDEFEGIYQVKFNVPGNSRNQTFFVTQAYLIDDNDMLSIYPTLYNMFSPFLELNLQDININVNFTNGIFETTLPTLTLFTYEKGLKNSFKFKFSTTDGESGISSRHNPYVFVQGFQSQFKQISSTLISKVGLVSNYEAIATLDYSLTYHGCLFSIYGITDNHLNTNGYSALDLQALSYPYYYKQPQNEPTEPIIESWSVITQEGGKFTIYGKRFAEGSQVEISGAETLVEFQSANILVVNINPTINSFTVQVKGTNTMSNLVSISPILFSANSIYVDPESTCITECGTFAQPFPSIKKALDAAKRFTSVVLKDGVYQDEDNTDLDVSKPYVEITSLNGPSKTIIDCQSYSYFLKISEIKQFSLSGITIKNCVGNKGGALYIESSTASISNVYYVDNMATNGAAIYSLSSDIELENTLFDNNRVWHEGAAIYSHLSKINIKGELTRFKSNTNLNPTIAEVSEKDILCQNSSIRIEDEVSFVSAFMQCFDGCDSSYSRRSLCQDYNLAPEGHCGDSICQSTESCLTCPNECSCHIGGLIMENFEQNCEVEIIDEDTSKLIDCVSLKNSTLTTPILQNYMGGIKKVVVRLFGFIKLENSQNVDFSFVGSHFGFILKVNGLQHYYFNQNTKFNETKSIYLSDRHAHFVEIILFSNHPDGSQRSFNFLPFKNPNIKFFYSNLVCGDGISNDLEKKEDSDHYCVYDNSYPTYNSEIKCGDGICNEDPNECYQDCYKEMTKTCPTRKVPDGHISPGFYFSGDTLGDLISNQFIWRLPGSEHLSFGFDIVKGEESPHPLFQFDYCSDVASNVVEDPYRGNVYQIPPEFHGKAYPQCTYSTSTESFSSTIEMQSEMEKSTSASFSASVGASGKVFSGGVSASYSQEKSIKESRKMSSSQSETIFKTDLVCKSSFVELDQNKISLHPALLDELDNVKDMGEMVKLVKKHGTHFYKKTYLGGKLSQITITKSSEVSTENKDDWTESVSGSFSASVSSPTFSVSGSVSASVDKSQSEEEQQKKQDNSKTSRLLIYGGIAAAFSPAEDGMSSPGFKEWAQSIDVLPVPVDYQLYPIRGLFNTLWVNRHGHNISQLWEEAEMNYYFMNNDPGNNRVSYSLIFEFDQSSFSTPDQDSFKSFDLPILDITYYLPSSEPNGVAKKIQIPLYLQYTNVEGKRSYNSYMDTTDEKFVTKLNMGAFYNPNTSQQTIYPIYDVHPNVTLKYPIKFDFSTFDIFSSVQKPIIKILTSPGSPKISSIQPSKIINWKTYKAILFNPTNGQVVSDTDKYYATSALEHYWSFNGWSQKLGPNPSTNGFIVSTGNLVCSPSLNDHQCFDEVEFSYRGDQPDPSATRPNTPRDPSKVSSFKKQLSANNLEQTRSWFSFSAPISPEYPKDVFFAETVDRIGMKLRIMWLKIFYPDTQNPWKFDILTYHLLSDPEITTVEKSWSYFLDTVTIFPSPIEKQNSLFYKLVPFAQSPVAKQLFYYHNYNYNGNYKLNPHYSTFWRQIYGDSLDIFYTFVDPDDGSRHKYRNQ
ncbi:hypothetical protein CYY_001040 [Polysphondylium violaceum]|uniref:MACPF domain-containing protein n=1 Tax=Polysphondylium violaceum TaxID=133409 RepID=A0A8J4V508_9MYCE|nr:hypothetical protein CYY_001040 [Polysphondylium violaceum]